jgi:hypothetical protein
LKRIYRFISPAYAAWVREKFEHLPMIGLGGGELELVLDEVYVPLAFAPQELDRWGAGKDAGVHPVDVDVACDVLHEEEREDHAPCSAGPGQHDPRA